MLNRFFVATLALTLFGVGGCASNTSLSPEIRVETAHTPDAGRTYPKASLHVYGHGFSPSTSAGKNQATITARHIPGWEPNVLDDMVKEIDIDPAGNFALSFAVERIYPWSFGANIPEIHVIAVDKKTGAATFADAPGKAFTAP